jgi:predicted phage tail component-like protein
VNNFLIWNGVNSNTIQGLRICEIPPISKPAIRTSIIEIDGKDGDFVELQGYESYKKSVKIGLYGNYDINQIAKYFTGSGQVIFSNEFDKYYNAEIIEQINFERLVLFKTANVKFHCQPFKYLVDEQPVILEITDQNEVSVTNQGLEISKPVITLTGSEVVEISVNGVGIFQINIDDSYVTVDSEIEECYKDNLQTLKNRQMTGQFPTLQPGENIVSWSGNLIKIQIEPKSRWF